MATAHRMLLDSYWRAKELRFTRESELLVTYRRLSVSERKITRREVLKKAAYITPAILTVQANFSFASAGSGDYSDEKKTVEYLGCGDDKDKKKKNPKSNDTNNNDKKNWTNKTHF